MPSPGDTICGDLVLERLAPASLGAKVLRPVFVASRPGVSKMWLTLIDGELTPTSMDLSRFMAGANALLELRHPSLCRAVVVDREMDYCVVGYELLASAEVLGDLIGRKQAQPPLGRTALELARGIAFLHRNGFVHGLVTPATVLVWEGVTVLWQYGLAGLCVPDLLGPRAHGAGTEAVAPELAQGDPATPASDVFGWGAVVASIASGRSPDLAVPAAREGKLHELHAVGLGDIVQAAVQIDPRARPAGGVELLQQLTAELADGAAGGAPRPWESQSGSVDGLQALAAQYLEEMHAMAARAPVVEAGVPGGVEREDTSGALGRVALKRVESGPIKLVEKRRADAAADPRSAGAASPKPPPAPSASPAATAPPAAAAPPMPEPDEEPAPVPPAAATRDIPDPEPPRGADVAPGGVHPREPEDPSGWMRGREGPPPPAPPVADRRPPWPRAQRLGDGLRKRSFGEPGAPDPADTTPTPKEGLGLGALDDDARPELEPEPGVSPADSGTAAPAPGDSAEGPTEPTELPPERTGVSEVSRTPAAYKPPRMPGPHGPPPVVFAILLALLAGGLAVLGTARGVQAHGSFSALFGEGRGEDAEAEAAAKAARPDTTHLIACPDGTTVLTGDPDDELAGVCMETAEYPGWMEPPEHGMSFVDAQKLCADRGRRLCTKAEWRRACGGLADRKWPYGDEYVRGHCKSADSGDKVVARSGQRSQCVSPQGVADLVGNVGEWVAEGVVVGGSVDTRKPTCRTEAKVPKKGRENVGLRCCVDLR